MKKVFPIKKRFSLRSAWFFCFAGPNIAAADLITISSDIFYNNTKRLYWYNNPIDFNNLTRDEQLEAISELNVEADGLVFDDWVMAAQVQVNSLFTTYDSDTMVWKDESVFVDEAWVEHILNMSWRLYGRAVSSTGFVGSDVVLEQKYHGTDPSAVYFYDFSPDTSDTIGAWVVSTSPVPEPSTLLLIASGLIGYAGLKRKLSKK